jgi:hypothetical protein
MIKLKAGKGLRGLSAFDAPFCKVTCSIFLELFQLLA